MNKTKLNIPFYSQHSEDIEESWRPKACAITCLKMILDFDGQNANVSDLIEEGLAMDGYSSAGWEHETLVRILRNHNVSAYKQEFRSMNFFLKEKSFQEPELNPLVLKGFNKMVENILKGKPVMVSVEKDFGENKDSHLILIDGFEEDDEGLEGFFYSDPNDKEEPEKRHFVELKKFKNYWRKLAIFVD